MEAVNRNGGKEYDHTGCRRDESHDGQRGYTIELQLDGHTEQASQYLAYGQKEEVIVYVISKWEHGECQPKVGVVSKRPQHQKHQSEES